MSLPAKKRIEKDARRSLPTRIFCCNLKLHIPYDEESDSITCPAENQLINVGIRHSKSKSGFVSEQSVYRCKACCECPLNAQCTKSKTGRTLQFSKSFRKFRVQSQPRITTYLGKQLRLNHSIQSEGKFGVNPPWTSHPRFHRQR